MSDNNNTNKGGASNYTGVFRLASPTDPHRQVIKRRRQVVSCIPCRNRKLKCDRQQPCASCVKRHDEAGCRFFAGSGGRGSGGGGGGGGQAKEMAIGTGAITSTVKKKEVRAKLQMLEDLVSGLMSQSQPDNAGPMDVTRTSSDLPAAATTTTVAAATTTTPATSVVPAGNQSDPAQSTTMETTTRAPVDGVGGRLSREGNEIRYVGVTNYTAVLESIRDLQGFVDADFTSSPSAISDQPQQSAEQRYHHEHQNHQQQQRNNNIIDQQDGFNTYAVTTIDDVLSHLPARAECDKIFTFYFQQIYMIPVLIHTGQFQRAYERFWNDPSSTSLLWLSMLFSLMSTSVFLQSSKARATTENPVAPELTEKIATFSSMSYRCLLSGNYLQGKPYSVEATLTFGMHLVLQKRDADPLCWHMIGTAVRLAQRAGYHRDASALGANSSGAIGISPFEEEMRRRAWQTLEYFDVVYSFQLGVPPIINIEHVDAGPPSNLLDEEFDEESSALPASRPTTDFTPILGHVFFSRQVKLLHRVVQQALAVRQPLYRDVLSLDEDLRILHQDVPPSLRYRPIRESSFSDVSDVIMRRLHGEIMYLKCMCVLHRRYLTFERQNSSYSRSRKTCIDASLRLLDVQAEFDEHSGENGRLYEKRYMLTNTGYHDFLLAAMCICLDLTVGPRNDSSNQQDHERKSNALRRARAIWIKMADRSKEAAHAIKVLDQILSRVSSSGQTAASPPPPPPPPPTNTTNRLATPVQSGPSGSNLDNPNRSSESQQLQQVLPILKPTRPPVAPSRSWSEKWNFGEWDDIGRRHSQNSGDIPENAQDLDVNWNHIDCLIFNRQLTTGSSDQPAVTTVPDSENTNPRLAREGWPYPAWIEDIYKRHGADPDASNFRTWSRSGMSLTGFVASERSDLA